ncbi:monovalent cation/H+ antiporter complex subunit F [Desulfonatronum thioautotrophicum]|uniref:monovalent cation/H+ antiporter complex subunit F n=1 Tax=Desulfonatronum thioautotrophicum TaxID=617001 RepID=UPI0005EB5303|nr:monovalent cation/H+ antiporter complex subunit F [Desulfonatronum thioautotrophicum]
MQTFFISIALVLCIALLIPFYRVYKGPTVFDRLLGAAAVGAKILTLILLFGLMFDRLDMFIDISLGYAILNFVGVIAMAKYFRSSARSAK